MKLTNKLVAILVIILSTSNAFSQQIEYLITDAKRYNATGKKMALTTKEKLRVLGKYFYITELDNTALLYQRKGAKPILLDKEKTFLNTRKYISDFITKGGMVVHLEVTSSLLKNEIKLIYLVYDYNKETSSYGELLEKDVLKGREE